MVKLAEIRIGSSSRRYGRELFSANRSASVRVLISQVPLGRDLNAIPECGACPEFRHVNSDRLGEIIAHELAGKSNDRKCPEEERSEAEQEYEEDEEDVTTTSGLCC